MVIIVDTRKDFRTYLSTAWSFVVYCLMLLKRACRDTARTVSRKGVVITALFVLLTFLVTWTLSKQGDERSQAISAVKFSLIALLVFIVIVFLAKLIFMPFVVYSEQQYRIDLLQQREENARRSHEELLERNTSQK